MHSQSLDSLLAEALRNNPQLRALEWKVKAGEHRVEGIALPPPTVGLEFSQIPVGNFNVWNKSIANNVSFSQMFMLGGKLESMREMERKSADISRLSLEEYRVELAMQVRTAYFALWTAEHHIEVQKASVENLKMLEKVTEELVPLRRAQLADVALLQAEIASAEVRLASLENPRQTALFNLNTALGRRIESDSIEISMELTLPPFTYSEKELSARLAEENPSLQKMRGMIAMTGAEMQANHAESAPDLMLQAMLMRMPQGMILTAGTQTSSHSGETAPAGTEWMYSMMASVTLPFAPWSKAKFSAKNQELQAMTESITAQIQTMEREMTAKLHIEIAKLRTAHKQIALFQEKVLPLYRQALESQILAYRQGNASVQTILETSRMILMKEEDWAMAQMDYLMALAEIEAMTGRK